MPRAKPCSGRSTCSRPPASAASCSTPTARSCPATRATPCGAAERASEPSSHPVPGRAGLPAAPAGLRRGRGVKTVEISFSALTPIVCALAESAILVGAFVGAVLIRFEHLNYEQLLLKALLSALVVQLCFYYTDLYEESSFRWRIELFLR